MRGFLRVTNSWLVLVMVAALPALSKGSVLLVGGALAETNADVIDRFILEAGGPGVARIGTVTTASSDPADSAIYYEELFLSYGAASVTWIPVTEKDGADSQEVADLIAEQTGVFFGGGDQERIYNAWYNADGSESLGLVALKTLESGGGIVGGTSAGAACQSGGHMIAGGLSYDALMYGAYPGGYNPLYPNDLCYIEGGGLGFVDGYIVDTHFSERGREGRLIQLLLDTQTEGDPSTQRAIGMDEDMGLFIDASGNAEVLGLSGTGGVMIVSTEGAVKDELSDHTKVVGVKVSHLTQDDGFNLYDGTVTLAPWKTAVDGREPEVEASSSNNIFSSPDKPLREYGVFRSVSKDFWWSQSAVLSSYTYESQPTFSVEMTKTSGYAYAGNSPIDHAFVVSYVDMEVNIDYTILTRGSNRTTHRV